MHKRNRIALVTSGAAVAVALAGIQLAAANSATYPDSDLDSIADGTNIVSVSQGHNSKKTLVHTVTMDGPLFVSDEDQVVLQVVEKQDPGCVREMIYPPVGKSDIFGCDSRPSRDQVKITKANKRTLEYTFGVKDIGDPRAYDWRFVTRSCPQLCTTLDTAPDQPGSSLVYFHHRLR